MHEPIRILKPRKAINKAFLKVKPIRSEIECFKTNLIQLLDRMNDAESEEFHKNLVIDFLKKTYYDPDHFVNTKGRNDLVIHNADKATSSVGVVIEAKKPTNKNEMITTERLNAKAFQELVLYYLRERITHNNLEVKYLIATNINEWFIFDALLFDRLFAQNKNLVKQFNDFEGGRLADTKTDFFYKQIAEPFIAGIKHEIECTHFDIREYEKPLRNDDRKDDNKLIALFKLLSPGHLLKLPFANDSNSLDKRFYGELLHIIGLTETKEGSKKIIERNKDGERNTGSLIENAIIKLDSLDKITRLQNPGQFGANMQERYFNVGLELCITWINRILFLKLLEAQLVSYHKGDASFGFLNMKKIKDYDNLNSLFFEVLARKQDERNEDVKTLFAHVPYLNSSLFEPTEIEQTTLFISNLSDDKTMPVYASTVLKDDKGKKRTGNINPLEYLFSFLDAYDFASEGSEEIQEDNKTLINASVLGLIFEKINGYKDGSFFTPGFITMYMCRETIRKAVIQKFNDAATPLLRGVGGVSKNRREIIPYNPILKQYARNLRNNSTKSEIILWKELKGKFENKYDFHRQKPIDNYIADFYCYELKLVIELDGITHSWEETQKKDYTKECRLNELGVNVLRFADEMIHEQLNAVLDTIRRYIDGFEKRDLSAFMLNDSPLNALSHGEFILDRSEASGVSTALKDGSEVAGSDTPLNPLSRGDFGSTGQRFQSLEDVYEQIGDDRLFTRQQANDIINSLKICDPAVGSGHFLVSALNEMIAIKHDLRILQDREGKRLKEYHFEVVNDELIVTDEDGELFEYKPTSKESLRIQKTLFHEKQSIIENCLFGVDINPNSVKICRLRLWIELLKNAYYKNEAELETLPNIDINIKCGNSLISRFALDADLKQALKKSKWNINSYRIAVDTYRNAQGKEQKREMERLINDIKTDFRTEISLNDPKVKKLRELKGALFTKSNEIAFDWNENVKADWNAKVEKMAADIQKLDAEIDEIKANKIFENAFEWRFEFPEVLDDNGDFVGFDVVIGNPPYGVSIKGPERNHLVTNLSKVPDYEIYYWFIDRGFQILREKGLSSLIIPNSILFNVFAQEYRLKLFEKWGIKEMLDCTEINIFEDATVRNVIFQFAKNEIIKSISYRPTNEITSFEELASRHLVSIKKEIVETNNQNWGLIFKLNNIILDLVQKIKTSNLLANFYDATQGYIPYRKSDLLKIYDKEKAESIVKNREWHCSVKVNDEYKEEIYGESINKFTYKRTGSYIWYGKHLATYVDLKFFNQKRLLIREITNPGIIACIVEEEFVNDPQIICIIEKENSFSIELLWAILNSKLATFYHFNSSPKATKGAFPKILVYDVNNFPLPSNLAKVTDDILKSIVSKIIEKKRVNPATDTFEQEKEIDRIIYQLYNLTAEEIEIIENYFN
jgi:very-short-patch-repair endonuclease